MKQLKQIVVSDYVKQIKKIFTGKYLFKSIYIYIITAMEIWSVTDDP